MLQGKVPAVVLYGAGRVGQDVAHLLAQQHVRVECFLDRRAQANLTVATVPVYSLDDCPLTQAERARMPVVVSVFNRDADTLAIAQELGARGFGRVLSFLDFHAIFAPTLGDRFWLTDRGHVERHERDIQAVDGLWADYRSRSVYRSLIALRRTGEYAPALAPQPNAVQYFPTDVPGWPGEQPVRLVDCGAYQGDTLQQALALGIPIATSAHFEPDLDNFEALTQVARERRSQIPGAVTCWPCAVSLRSDTLRFNSGLQEGSTVSATGDSIVSAVALDQVLVNWRPTLIKMDIEGSEHDALLGAREIIERDRPALAICVYHRPDHLWSIPLLLSSWLTFRAYALHLRVHGFNAFDTVLYACPSVEQHRAL